MQQRKISSLVTEAMGAVWTFLVSVLTVWLVEASCLERHGTNGKHDGLYKRLTELETNYMDAKASGDCLTCSYTTNLTTGSIAIAIAGRNCNTPVPSRNIAALKRPHPQDQLVWKPRPSLTTTAAQCPPKLPPGPWLSKWWRCYHREVQPTQGPQTLTPKQ